MLRRVFFVPAVVAISVVALAGCVDNDLEEVQGSLFGRACKEGTGEGLANILVKASSESVERTAPTSADGSYNIGPLPRGEYTVVAVLADDTEQLVHPAELKPVVRSNAPTFVGEFGCSEPPDEPDSGSVAGQICNRHTGELVSEATVEVIAADGTVLASGVTDSEGNFRVDDVPEGNHIVSIRADGYSRAFPATIAVEQTTVLELNAGTCGVPFGTGCTILGSLCDPEGGEGSKLAGARVEVIRTDAPDGEPQSAVADITDTNGDFYISALIPGTYDVSISSSDPPVNETFFNQACNAGEETVIVGPDACADRTPIGRLQGQLCNLGQLEGYFTGTVYLLQGGVVRYEVVADADGRFNFDVVAVGTYDLHLGQPARRII
ncbi:MAG TPA: carboxypeptidase regulatory-like domain-containing protein, partial [Myxococcota bacterium]